MAGRSYQTEAVVLRSFRLGEADRVLHLYTLEHGRVGAVAKGVRKTKSRFGGRLEPLSHVEVALYRGSSDLQTVTGVDLVRSHRETREDYGRLAIGLIGAEAMLRLFTEEEGNERAFLALTRFLDVLDETPTPAASARAELDPLALAFQLKLLAEGRIVVEVQLLVRQPLGVEQRPGADAVAAPARRIHLNSVHYGFKRGSGRNRSRLRPL